MNVNLSNEFSQIISFIVGVFKSVIGWLDGIIIIGDSTSLLDLNIAFTVFTILFAAVFNVVKAGAVNELGDTVYNSAKSKVKEVKEDRENQQEENNTKQLSDRSIERFKRSQGG